MNKFLKSTIAAASVATMVVSFFLSSCEGRKMSNMKPAGETVEVNIDRPEMMPEDMNEPADTIANI